MIRVGVIGYGYWGPNIVRNLHGLEATQVEMICDKSPGARARAKKAHPGIKTVADPNELLTSPVIDAVAVITPVWTHYELAKRRSKTASMCSSRSRSLPASRASRRTDRHWRHARN